MKKIEEMISNMIFLQDVLENDKTIVKEIVVSMFKTNQLTKNQYEVFALKHGLKNKDKAKRSFMQIAAEKNIDLNDVLKEYNSALKIISKNIVNKVFSRDSAIQV